MANWRGARTLKNASTLEKHLGRHRNSAEAMIGNKLNIVCSDTSAIVREQPDNVVSIVDINHTTPHQNLPSNGKRLNICDQQNRANTNNLGDTGIQILQLNTLNKLILSTLLRGLSNNERHIDQLNFTKWAPLSTQNIHITSNSEHTNFLLKLKNEKTFPQKAFHHLNEIFSECVINEKFSHSIKTDGFTCQHNIKFDIPQKADTVLNMVSLADDCVVGVDQNNGEISNLVLIYSVEGKAKYIKGSGPISLFFYSPVFITVDDIKGVDNAS